MTCHTVISHQKAQLFHFYLQELVYSTHLDIPRSIYTPKHQATVLYTDNPPYTHTRFSGAHAHAHTDHTLFPFFLSFYFFSNSHCAMVRLFQGHGVRKIRTTIHEGTQVAENSLRERFCEMCMPYFDKGQYKLFGLFSINMRSCSDFN